MTTETIKAIDNPDLANKLLEKALAEEPAPQIEITPPSDTTVTLPGGLVTFAGEVLRTAEVRELNGRDEEIMSKISSPTKLFSTVLSRAVVSVGDKPVTEAILDDLLLGDRDALLIAIYKATFGKNFEVDAVCNGCNAIKTIGVDLDTDIPVSVLADPASERKFLVKGRKHEYLVLLPTGVTQKEMSNKPDATSAELGSIILENTVLEIDGRPVVSKTQVQNLGIADRQAILNEMVKRNPGPKFNVISVTCPDCESEVQVPISLGTMFQF
jgi:hypothetical protein